MLRSSAPLKRTPPARRRIPGHRGPARRRRREVRSSLARSLHSTLWLRGQETFDLRDDALGII